MSDEIKYDFQPVGEGDSAVTPSEEQVASVTEFAKANSFSQEQAQAFMEYTVQHPTYSTPEKYEFDAKDAPEELVTAVSKFAQENGLSQAHAEAILQRELASQTASQVPEKYAFAKIKDADGKEIDVSTELAEQVSAYAKENNMTQEQAQKLMDREIRLQEEADAAYRQQEEDLKKEWRAEAMKDSVLSKGNFEENLGVSKRALQKFFPSLAETADEHMFLEHPAVLRGLFEIGKLLKEDGEIIQSGRQDGPSSHADRVNKFYPTMVSK